MRIWKIKKEIVIVFKVFEYFWYIIGMFVNFWGKNGLN